MKNRPLVIPEPKAHKELNPSQGGRRNGGCFTTTGISLVVELLHDLE